LPEPDLPPEPRFAPADKEKAPALRLALIAAGVFVVVIAAAILYWHRTVRPPVSALPLAEEERAYLNRIEIAEVRMSAAQNFLGDTVTYLDGRITNQGTRQVRQVQVEMEFVDMLGQVVLRETARPVNSQTPPLQPGETRAFQISFEHMPMEWNQAPPRIRIVRVSF
jgi:hypothetical protein